jgi:hypothetical protein
VCGEAIGLARDTTTADLNRRPRTHDHDPDWQRPTFLDRRSCDLSTDLSTEAEREGGSASREGGSSEGGGSASCRRVSG